MLKHFLKNMLIQIYHQKTKRKDPIQESKKLLTLSRRKEEADQFEHKKKNKNQINQFAEMENPRKLTASKEERE